MGLTVRASSTNQAEERNDNSKTLTQSLSTLNYKNYSLFFYLPGSPEMAFVHAMAAAAAASFIARACRDGQLTSCGCSRSSRPRQLHTDWTWGGCGDDLEFGYK